MIGEKIMNVECASLFRVPASSSIEPVAEVRQVYPRAKMVPEHFGGNEATHMLKEQLCQDSFLN